MALPPKAPPKLDLVFGPPPKGGPGPALDSEAPPPADDQAPDDGDTSENDDALNSAIDEMFNATDPDQRREAFKTACKLCEESNY